MELKHDCIREVMLYLEKELDLHTIIPQSQINLKNYSSDDITYTVLKLSEAGFLDTDKMDLAGNILIKSITYNGHIFLDNIRDVNIWKETKSKISKIASVSLPIIQQVAGSIISKKLGL